MHDDLRLFGTNNHQNVDRFLIYERDLLCKDHNFLSFHSSIFFRQYTRVIKWCNEIEIIITALNNLTGLRMRFQKIEVD